MTERAPRPRGLLSNRPAELLKKGIEEEVFTGTADGRVEPLSHRIAADLPGFSTEPDARNVEYTTAPHRDYRLLIDRLMAKRCRLRRYLREIGDYTLVPGGTMPFETSEEFHLSNHDNPYYRFIAETYGVRVVTASTHINIGIDDPEALLRAYRVFRCEAPVYLALTASSPFLRGEVTGYHSTRWHVFPETPSPVPPFASPSEFASWVEDRIHGKEMFNPRHLWLSVRPNGPATPYSLSRLELRICDRISRPNVLAAVVGLAEARVWHILEDPELDPLLHLDADRLLEIAHRNEQAAAEQSLDGEYTDWRSGRSLRLRDWLATLLEEARGTARDRGFETVLEPLESVLDDGNLAQIWLSWHRQGASLTEVMQRAMHELAAIDRHYDASCPEPPPLP